MADEEFRSEVPVFPTISIGTREPAAAEPSWRPSGGRRYYDCRELPKGRGCSLVIAGDPDEVLEAALRHATGPAHQEADTPALRDMIERHIHDVPQGDATLA